MGWFIKGFHLDGASGFFATLILFSLFCGFVAQAAPANKFAFEISYGAGAVSPTDFNRERAGDYGQTMKGYDRLMGPGLQVGYRMFSFAWLLLSYEMNAYSQSDFSISGAPVTDTFRYEPLALLADIPLIESDTFFLSLRGGGGVATKFQFEQRIGAPINETLLWKANPTFVRGGLVLGLMILRGLGFVVSAYYDSVSSALKADGNSSVFSYYHTGNDYRGAVKVEMSGVRYSGGLRVAF
jgi:hypothetical protein